MGFPCESISDQTWKAPLWTPKYAIELNWTLPLTKRVIQIQKDTKNRKRSGTSYNTVIVPLMIVRWHLQIMVYKVENKK